MATVRIVVVVGVAIVVGMGCGLVQPPHGRHAADPRVLVPRLGMAALSVQALLLAGIGPGGATLAVGLVLLAAFVFANRHLLGFGVLFVGLAMNALVVVANLGMPVRAEALVRAEVAAAEELVVTDVGPGRHLEENDDRLLVLADIIPVRALRTVVSFGDLVAAMGIAVAAGDLVRYARRPQPTTRRRASHTRPGRRLAPGEASVRPDRRTVRPGSGDSTPLRAGQLVPPSLRRPNAAHDSELAAPTVDARPSAGAPTGEQGDRTAALRATIDSVAGEVDLTVVDAPSPEGSASGEVAADHTAVEDPHPGLEPLPDWLAPNRDQLVGSGSRRS